MLSLKGSNVVLKTRTCSNYLCLFLTDTTAGCCLSFEICLFLKHFERYGFARILHIKVGE